MAYRVGRFSINQKVTVGLVSGLAVLLAVGMVAYRNMHSLIVAADARKTSFETRAELNSWLTDLTDAETAQRGYLITDRDSYLTPFDHAVAAQKTELQKIRGFAGSKARQAEIEAINRLFQQKLTELNQTISLRRTQGFAAAQAVVLTDKGQSTMDTIRTKMATLDAQEAQAITSGVTRVAQLQRQTRLAIIGGTTIAVAIMAVAIYFTNKDLSARKKTEDDLTRSERRLTAIIDNMAEGLVVANTKGELVLFNKAAESMLGVGMMRAAPKAWAKTYGNYLPDQVTPFPADKFPLVRALKGEVTHNVEIYVKNEKQMAGMFINVSGTPLRDADDNVIGSIAVFNDISTRKAAAAMVFAEKAKAEAMLGSIGDAVFAIDNAGRIILFNPVAAALSGQSAETALHKPYTDVLSFYNEKTGQPDDAFIQSALRGTKAEMASSTALQRKDGTTIPVADSAAPIRNTAGAVEGAVIVFRDITREKELTHLKDEFVSIASHELRTPMGAIRAFTSMILAGDYGPVNNNLVEPLTDIRASTLRLVELVNDLLDVARIEAGRIKFEMSDFDLTQAVRETVNGLLPLAKEKGIGLTAHTDGAPRVQADSNKVKQVLTNLISNAYKFTDTGSIAVAVVSGKETVEVSITDTGLGIAPEDQAKLFGKFEQVSSTQKGRPTGTGLGLYLSRQMVRKMGGNLWIKQSAAGKGSVFAFTLVRSQTPLAQKIKEDFSREAAIQTNQT